FGVPSLEIVEGKAPTAFDGLARPDRVFVGGGASDAGLLDTAMDALRPGGRLVVNAVTLEAEALLLARRATAGGELIRVAITRAEPIGRMEVWRAAMPLTQWAWVKP